MPLAFSVCRECSQNARLRREYLGLDRAEEVKHLLLLRDREIKEIVDDGIRFRSRRPVCGMRGMGLDGDEEIARPPVMKEEEPLTDAPERRGAELVRSGGTLDDVVGKAGPHE